MKFSKKSLGQNFLIDKNIIKKIINSVDISKRNIIEIGPGKGALTDEIIKKRPKSLHLIEKDYELSKELNFKYLNKNEIKVHNEDILKFNLKKIHINNSIIFGNLPYNISSQILVKFLKSDIWPPEISDFIFMFQKELGEKILGKFPSKNYGRMSILSNYRLTMMNKFNVSPNCFSPKPKVWSVVIHFKPRQNNKIIIKDIKNLEKVTNILFSNKRKMIKKNIYKILDKDKIKKIDNLDLKSRPANIKPEVYYRVTELIEFN